MSVLLSLSCRNQGRLPGGFELGFEELGGCDPEKAHRGLIQEGDEQGQKYGGEEVWTQTANQVQPGWWECVKVCSGS